MVDLNRTIICHFPAKRTKEEENDNGSMINEIKTID